MGCELRDLGSPSLHRNLQKSCHRILTTSRIYQQIFHRFFAESFLSSPNRLSGIWDLLSARSSIGTSEALGSLAVRGTPCPHGLRPTPLPPLGGAADQLAWDALCALSLEMDPLCSANDTSAC